MKTEINLGQDAQQIQIFKALADPIRLQILQYIKQTDHPVACGEVGRAVNISKTSGSYHFKLLEAAGLITAEKIAREKYVTINWSTFETYVTNFTQRL
ncbi:ArsR/SmtB family transcription factor [Lactiplantibacillus mudanjiangensis]|uniref:Transcriptional regulator [Lactobacillus heilongjiangensis] n=1 Tax=Lactiplantibacillus mudanjiangensis TaxID=1296538 RepID=A0A660E8E6_9LACO|nr:winged helix-turn-helix domain-containing protein [Lactiplantibacillus mudanjiangensis]VDG19653.1 transcriptional regulator [Lactobacillus heilongjiangensis] [Lactiplantibacillus mudanjiangensis]VDG24977.1 transcriptional regulator [Lactobacillus heilongjiangensis] [Lactiplantibacillus mudanjiangensis]VDG29352.1 transcriptional regulator [Lactobacillus heilongjiangensis] [Lactiplantibacillus mudanjiangensis]VDG31099.1 transcriptional regulator [Lactobacillus heilongjiangensis] [Lactiplantiba